MSTAGLLSVILGIDTAQFASGLKNAESSLGGFSSKFSGFASLGAGIGFTSITAGFGEIAAVVGDSLAEFEQQDQANRKLQSVLTSTGYAAGFTAEQIQDLASELQLTTRFADEVTDSAAAVLATFTQVHGDNFTRAIKDAQDLSTILGQDLQSSVVQIGKALNDPAKGFTALKRAGVSFSETQIAEMKRLHAAGDDYGAQIIILNELEKEFGGAAVESAKTAGGQMEILQHQIGEVKEGIGGALSATVKHITATQTAFVSFFADATTWRATFEFLDPTGFVSLANAADDFDRAQQLAIASTKELARAQREAQDAANASVQAAIDAQEKIQRPMTDLILKLQIEIDTWGMSANAVEIYKASLDGVSEKNIEIAKGLAAKLDALEKEKKANDEAAKAVARHEDQVHERLKSTGKSIHEEVMTPLEKYNAELKKLEEVHNAGMFHGEFLSDTDYQRKKLALANEFHGAGEHDTDLHHAGAVQLGSTEAYSALVSAQSRGQRDTGIDGLKKNSDSQLADQKLQTVYLRTLTSQQTPIIIGPLG